MNHRHVINPSYYCERGKGGDLILVFNAGAYVLAEYSEMSGEVRWQRVIPAEQKKSVENWLNQHFPPTKKAQSAHA
jgi:hypothetical protein